MGTRSASDEGQRPWGATESAGNDPTEDGQSPVLGCFAVVLTTASFLLESNAGSGESGELGLLYLVGGFLVTVFLYRKAKQHVGSIRPESGWITNVSISPPRAVFDRGGSSDGPITTPGGDTGTVAGRDDSGSTSGRNATVVDDSAVRRFGTTNTNGGAAGDLHCDGCGGDLREVVFVDDCPYCGQPVED